MPSATHLYSFPVPLGRRGSAAAAVVGLHVLLVAGLIFGLAIQGPPEVIPIPPPVVAKRTVEPVAPPLRVDDGTWTFPVPQPRDLTDDTPLPDVRPPPAERSGEDLTALPPVGPSEVNLVRQARVLHGEDPLYPAAARRLGEHGVVLLRVLVGAEGRAERIEIATSSGYARLDDAAVSAVRRWVFTPAAAGSGPVASWTTLRVVFRLTE